MNRRKFIGSVCAGMGIGLAGCSDMLSSVTGPPEPGDMVERVSPSDSYFTKIVLYDNGVAEITLREDHGDWKRIAITHALKDLTYDTDGKPDNAYKIWDAPEFAGPITVDLKSAIQRDTSYPSPRFKLKLLPAGKKNIINVGQTQITATFEVPESYLS